LAVAGVELDLASLWADCAPPPAAKRKPAMTVPILGSNYGKIYPPTGGAAALPAPVLARLEPARVAAAPSPSPSPSVAAQEPVVLPVLSGEAHSEWVRAYQEAQRHLGEAPAADRGAMAGTHLAFLKTTETSLFRRSS